MAGYAKIMIAQIQQLMYLENVTLMFLSIIGIYCRNYAVPVRAATSWKHECHSSCGFFIEVL